MLIADASLAVKWFIPERDSGHALAWLERYAHQLLVPDIFFSEVTNALWRRVRRKEMTLQEARGHVQSLTDMNLTQHHSQALMPEALHYAAALNHDYISRLP